MFGFLFQEMWSFALFLLAYCLFPHEIPSLSLSLLVACTEILAVYWSSSAL